MTSDDAHAWVEIYLNGIGWLRDDPTPAADTPAQTAPEEPIAAPIEPADNQPKDTPPAGDEPPAVPDIPAESQETPQKTDKSPLTSCILFGRFWCWLPPCSFGARCGSAFEELRLGGAHPTAGQLRCIIISAGFPGRPKQRFRAIFWKSLKGKIQPS